MTAPYGLIADLHCHDWSAFSSLDGEGRNTRLLHILHELDRVCQATLDVDGRYVVIAGDLFHTRGNVKPSVFNPVRVRVEYWVNRGITFLMIPGNHDLEHDESNKLGSSVEMLAGVPHVAVFSEPSYFESFAFVPWIKRPADFFAAVDKLCDELTIKGIYLDKVDLICHIGIDGTLSNMPAHGVNAVKLASYGFKRVFSGHYHHHKFFPGEVYSLGATSHQTWSDIGTLAGFHIVRPDMVTWFASHAPSFIDLKGDEDPEAVPLIVDGHYVRARLGAVSAKEVAEMRETLMGYGAKGVLIQSIPESAESKRAGVTAKSLTALDESIQTYVTERSYGLEVATICAAVMQEVRSI